MSRDCRAEVKGTVRVRLVCYQCEKVVWFPLELSGEDPDCLEWAAVSEAGWFRADDCIVCSEECADKFWDDDAWFMVEDER